MNDDGLGAAAGNLLPGVNMMKAALPVGRLAWQKLRLLGTYELEWLRLDEGEKALTVEELSDVEHFLRSGSVRPIMSMAALTYVSPDVEGRQDALTALRDAFLNEAREWCVGRGSTWRSMAPAIWERVVATLSDHVPSAPDDGIASAVDEFGDFLRSPLNLAKGSSAAREYVGRLRDLAGDFPRFVEASALAGRLRAAIAAAPMGPIISYRETGALASFDALYVIRDLRDIGTGDVADTDDLTRAGIGFRAVVLGAPGAGKSTFVRNLVRGLAESDEAQGGRATVLVTCRNYYNNARGRQIVEYAAMELGTEYNTPVPEAVLRDALTLGLPVFVFDGLDEITDINQRIEMVKRIHSFAIEFPAASVLVTSRELGYPRAPLNEQLFQQLRLDQFSPEQSHEYVERWFRWIKRPELSVEFDRESQSVADIKQNPLLLSLLCILYRERGSIPRRRRDIYAKCADLLFYNWDAHRHINQPEELHANGDRIMQEIARWVYTTASAQSGLEEQVIEKCIGQYLEATAGVETGEARRRAADFLDFCAGRAWLLGSVGAPNGQRVFSFTHRTFFEYFAAEAFARQSSSVDKIAELIVDAWTKDETSVLPELLLQAFDEKEDRGAAQVFVRLCTEAFHELLLLRLMDGVPLPAHARKKCFDELIGRWGHPRSSITEESFTALLSTNSDARSQFLNDYLMIDQPPADAILGFFRGWVALDLAGKTQRFPSQWSDAAAVLLEDYGEWLVEHADPVLGIWLALRGLGPVNEHDLSALVMTTAGGLRVGPAWLLVELSAWGGGELAIPARALRQIAANGRSARQLGYSAALGFAAAVIDRMSHLRYAEPAEVVRLPEPAFLAACYLVGVIEEVTPVSGWLEELLVATFGDAMFAAIDSRRLTKGDPSRPNALDSDSCTAILASQPEWLIAWAHAKRDHVSPHAWTGLLDDEEDESED